MKDVFILEMGQTNQWVAQKKRPLGLKGWKLLPPKYFYFNPGSIPCHLAYDLLFFKMTKNQEVNMGKKHFIVGRLAPVIAVSVISVASANVPDSLMPASICSCSVVHARYLEPFKEKIGHAKSLEEGRQVALSAVGDASRAVNKARFLVPWSKDLRSAQERIGALESRLRAAQSLSEIQAEFSSPVQTASAGFSDAVLQDQSPGVSGNSANATSHSKVFEGKCNYSTGEIIAIVLGFILGIIPGIILLFLLC